MKLLFNKMDLSIIIPLFNTEKYISQCLESILNENISTDNYEIIIIDDGSTDNSLIIAKEFSELYSNTKVYCQKNKGVSATRNKGINLARGKFIWFIDSDDYIYVNTVSRLIKIANDNILDILEFKLTRTSSRKLNLTNIQNKSNFKLNVLIGEEYASTRMFNDSACVYFYNKDFLINSKVKFIEGRIMEDMLFTAEIINRANRVAFYPLHVYQYCINPNSIWTNEDPQHYRKSIYDFVFMTKKYSELIHQRENKKINTTILKFKLQNMLYNIVKRLMRSNFNFFEINLILIDLSSNNLYPLHQYKGFESNRKIITMIFNNKITFFTISLIYRFLKAPIDYYFIKHYQNNREDIIKKHEIDHS